MTRMGGCRQWASEKRAVILCYHSIHPTCSFRSATPELFETHLQWLKEHCDVVPLQKLLSSRSWDRLSQPKVAITFDDGYLDNYVYAFPLLMKHQLSATFFFTVGLLERDAKVIERFQFLRRTDIEEIEPLTWQQAREMLKAGMELGSHTYSHPNLVLLGRAQLEWELKHAKEIMEERIGQRVDGLAYPFGKPSRHFNELTVETVRDAGYQYALAVCFRRVLSRDSRWALPRFFVTGDNLDVLASKVKGGWDLQGYFQEWSPLWLARMVSPLDFVP